jgi:hypothetical protein
LNNASQAASNFSVGYADLMKQRARCGWESVSWWSTGATERRRGYEDGERREEIWDFHLL